MIVRTVYTVYIRYFWQGFHQIYGHIRRIYTVLANPMYNPHLQNRNVKAPSCAKHQSGLVPELAWNMFPTAYSYSASGFLAQVVQEHLEFIFCLLVHRSLSLANMIHLICHSLKQSIFTCGLLPWTDCINGYLVLPSPSTVPTHLWHASISRLHKWLSCSVLPFNRAHSLVACFHWQTACVPHPLQWP